MSISKDALTLMTGRSPACRGRRGREAARPRGIARGRAVVRRPGPARRRSRARPPARRDRGRRPAPPAAPVGGQRSQRSRSCSPSAAIAIAMARGKAPDCHCFGQLHSAPAGWKTLARNGVLVLDRWPFIVARRPRRPGTGAFAWRGELEGVAWVVLALVVALAAVVAVGGYAVVHVMRNYGRVLMRLEASRSACARPGSSSRTRTTCPRSGSSRARRRPPSSSPRSTAAEPRSTTSASRATRSCCSSRARPAGRAPSSCRRSRSGSASTAASSRSPS